MMASSSGAATAARLSSESSEGGTGEPQDHGRNDGHKPSQKVVFRHESKFHNHRYRFGTTSSTAMTFLWQRRSRTRLPLEVSPESRCGFPRRFRALKSRVVNKRERNLKPRNTPPFASTAARTRLPA